MQVDDGALKNVPRSNFVSDIIAAMTLIFCFILRTYSLLNKLLLWNFFLFASVEIIRINYLSFYKSIFLLNKL